METATESLCPDPEVLAAFVDQGLRADESTQLEAHLAECDNCRLIVARVVDTQSAVLTADARTVTPGRPGSSRRVLPFSRAHMVWGAGSLLAAAAVLTMMLNVGNRSMLAELATAVGEERTVEARLSGFRYGPVRAPVRSGGSSAAASDNWTLYAAAGKIRETAERDPSAPNLHALGVAHLVLGHYDEAVRAIEDAIAGEPEPPQYHSDLAAAYLARAKHLDRPDDLPRALGAAERAIKGNETLLEARFNRALALEALYLEDQARQAWEDYLARDSASGWAADARTHLQTLQQRVAPQDGARNNSPPPITDTTVEAALDWLMRQGLPAWADATLADESERAASERYRLTTYAQQITATNGDRFASALAAIVEPDVSARRRAMAVRGLANARAMVEGDDTAKLEPTLLAACAEPHSALAPLCHLEVGRLDVIQRRDNNARKRIAMLQGVYGASAYLDGRLDLLDGYRSMFEGDYVAALERYQRAFQRLSDAKYSTLAGHAAGQIAEMFELVGFPSDAWQWRLRALRNSSAARDANLKYLTHVSAAESLVRSGNMSAAAQFVAAVEGSILETVPELRRVFLEVSRSRIALARGEIDTARAGFARADAIVARSTDFRAQRLKPDLLMLQANLEGSDAQWERARATLERAVLATGPERMPHRVRALLSHANISAQRPEWQSASEQSLAEALRTIQMRGTQKGSQPIRREDIVPAFETAGALIHAQPALQNVRGLHLVEQLREVLEGVPAGSGNWPLAEFENVVKGVAADAPLIVFSFTDRALLSWVIANGEIDFRERAVTPAQVTTLANRLTVHVSRNPEREDLWRPILAELYELLFSDVAALRTARELVIVSDGPLHRIPFGSLFDAYAGQYLFERTGVRLAPNVAFAVGGQAIDSPPVNALVIGDPELGGPHGGRFPRLTAARREAAEVGKLYRHSELMLGREATKAHVLAAVGQADVVHFAGHAMASATMAVPRLLLAGDPRDPTTTIAAGDLAGRLKPSTTVVLAACETSATSVDRATSLTSLSAAFLRSGAGSVVAALWPVDDSSGATFFPAVHRELLTGQSTSVAVARAQRACLRDQTCRRSAATWMGTTVYGRH